MARLALVTGASAGIGFQIARRLAERGYYIVGVGASDRILRLPEALPDVTVYPGRSISRVTVELNSCGPRSRTSANRWTWPRSTPG